MKKEPEVFIRHILESIGEIEGYTSGMSAREFLKVIL